MSGYGPTSYNIDINQLGTSWLPRFSINQPTPYQDALVEDIILNKDHKNYAADGSNIGMVKVRFIPADRGVKDEKLNWASPMDASIREYPLKNELVLVFYSLGRLFYTRRINSTNKVTESSWPGLSQIFSPQTPANVTADGMRTAAAGGPSYRPWGVQQQESLGDEFAENPTVRMVQPYEGDLIIYGRYGTTIRAGSSLFSNPTTPVPQPNLLLTVGQSMDRKTSTGLSVGRAGAFQLVQEDINKDWSSIWMVVDEQIVLNPATKDSFVHLRGSKTSNSLNYTGAQIFINSDRLILNSKRHEISLFAKKEINLSALGAITVASADDMFITARRNIQITADTGELTLAGSRVSIVGNGISIGPINYVQYKDNNSVDKFKLFIGLGDSTEQPMVLGGKLQEWLRDLMSAFAVELPNSIATLNPAPFIKKIAELQIQLQTGTFNSKDKFISE